MRRRIVRVLGEQHDFTVALVLCKLECNHVVYVRKDVPGYDGETAYYKHCASKKVISQNDLG